MAAAMALRLLPERRIFHSHRFPCLFFSSSSSSPPSSSSNSDDKATVNDDENKSSASSIFSDIKSRLRQHSPPPPPRRPYLYSSPPPERPTKLASLDEIRKNLEEFRSSSAAPDPHKKSSSSPLTSFQQIYNTTYGSRSENPDGENAETLSLDAIRESLRRIPKSESPIFNRFRGPRTVNPTLLNSLKDGLNVRKEEGASLGSAPLAIFRKELEERERSEMDSSSSSSQTEFLRAYSHKELGERLRSLRPEKAKSTKDWFSLEELSERLKELRKIHEKESRGGYFSSLRESLHQIKEADDRKKQASIRSPLSIFSPLLGLPAQPYLALPPKEQLVEKYFHPDNMSSAEKLKLELKKVRDEFKMSESDCGSSRVQIAQLTTKIKHLSTALHKKDKHSRKGLQEMVQRRKKLLKYLRRTDWDSYTFVLSKLGLRDNPDYKH